jgi:antitoxin (DNA-binding transcriptional repressor) of toxin-antitoxin stability system
MSSNTLEIIQGLAQAAANAYDGAHDERYSADGEIRKVGLKREEGCPLMDKRVNDGFGVRFSANSICITYQSDYPLKQAADPKFEGEIESMLNEVKKFLQREYKKITGNSVTLTKQGEPVVDFIAISRVRSSVQAHQHFKISGLKGDPILEPSRDSENGVMRKFLAQHSTKRPQNDTRKKG